MIPEMATVASHHFVMDKTYGPAFFLPPILRARGDTWSVHCSRIVKKLVTPHADVFW